MKPLVLATVALPLFVLAFAAGCENDPQGNNVACSPLVAGGVCFFPATQPAVRTQCGDIVDFCDKTGVSTPNLACVANGPTPGPAPGTAPAKVTLTGFVDVFSSGPDTTNLTVQIFDAAQITASDPRGQQTLGTTFAVIDPATERACDVDPAKGCSLPLVNGCGGTCNDGLDGRRDDMKYCRDNGAGGECDDRLRLETRYTIPTTPPAGMQIPPPSIPTNTNLVVRVTGTNGVSDSAWGTTVSFRIFLSTDDHACTSLGDTDCLDLSDPTHPKYQLNVTAISSTEFTSVATYAGLPGGIGSGLGAIAGQVRDCDNVRITDALVGTIPTADRLTYFSGIPMIPTATRATIGTDESGLFAALNLAPGPVQVQAAGALVANGPNVSFGAFDGFVYANTLSLVNLNGLH
jgi:hypothetical protein